MGSENALMADSPVDPATAAQLLEQLKPGLLGSIAGSIPRSLQARIDPEDVYQEACVRLQARLPEFRWEGEAAFRGYVMQIARHYIVSLLRRRSSDQIRFAEGSSDGPGLAALPAEALTASQELRNRDEATRALEKLKPVEAEVVCMRAVLDMTFPEIGEIVEMKEDAVRQIFNRAIKRLALGTGGS